MSVKAQLFLSYAREDEAEVAKLYQGLSDAGFKPWMDKKDIHPGEHWPSRIPEAIRSSDFFLACLSPNSVNKRGFLQTEIKEALDIWQQHLISDIYIVPVWLEHCPMPESLRDFQAVDISEKNGWPRLVGAIREGMKRRGKIATPAATSEEGTAHVTKPQPTTTKGFADFLNRPPGGWTGTLVLLGLGVAGNILSTLISLQVGASPWLLGLLVVSVFALLGGIYKLRRRATPRVLVPEDEQPQKHRGLIVLVGIGRPGEDPMQQSAGIAISYHQPVLQTCWLVATGGETGSLSIAQILADRCKAAGVQPYVRTVADPFNVQESYELVEGIYTQEMPQAGLAEDQVIADFTGGVKPMSAGMILACGDQRPMQYMTGRKGEIASIPISVKFAPRGRR